MKNIERPPLLSVIIPVYQAAPWLKRCVESVLLQTFQNMEIILVDDGSTDGSMEICDLYGKLDQRVHVIHQENRGLAGARTAGICRATGDYVTYVDADDWIERKGYEKMAEAAVWTQSDVISSSIIRHRKNRTDILSDSLPAGVYAGGKLKNCVKRELIFPEYFGHFGILPSLCCKWIKREAAQSWQKRVPERVTLGEDAACCFPLIWSAERVCLTRDTYYHYETREDSMTRRSEGGEYKKAGLILEYIGKLKEAFSQEELDLEKQEARYRLYLLKVVFEKELNLKIKGGWLTRFKEIEKQMAALPANTFQAARLDQLHMTMEERSFFSCWEKGDWKGCCGWLLRIKIMQKTGKTGKKI